MSTLQAAGTDVRDRKHVTDDELAQILALRAQGVSVAEIARRLDRTWGTIADHIGRNEAVSEEVTRNYLSANRIRAVDGWVKAMDAAAEKGDHRPMRDLLTDTGVIERQDTGAGTKVAVIIGLPESMRPQVSVIDAPSPDPLNS